MSKHGGELNAKEILAEAEAVLAGEFCKDYLEDDDDEDLEYSVIEEELHFPEIPDLTKEAAEKMDAYFELFYTDALSKLNAQALEGSEQYKEDIKLLDQIGILPALRTKLKNPYIFQDTDYLEQTEEQSAVKATQYEQRARSGRDCPGGNLLVFYEFGNDGIVAGLFADTIQNPVFIYITDPDTVVFEYTDKNLSWKIVVNVKFEGTQNSAFDVHDFAGMDSYFDDTKHFSATLAVQNKNGLTPARIYATTITE